MFCKKCGAEISEGGRFCPKCGYDTQTGKAQDREKQKVNVVEDNVVKFQVKPTFHLGYKLLTNFGKAILYTFLIWFFFIGEFDDIEEIDIHILTTIGLIILGIIVVYVIIRLIFEKIQYKHYEYNFYNTKVEYIDGFFNKEQKELKYKHIREVALGQNILQRMFNIGTIRIFTNATSGYMGNNKASRNMNGLQIHCVQNPKEQYQKVKELIDAASSDEE